MGYEIIILQNKSGWDKEEPTICISKGEPGWDEAIAAWRKGKFPTSSKEWKQGVFALTKEI